MQRISPWHLRGLSPLLRLILTWGLLEGVRSGFYGGYLPVHVQGLGLTLTVTGTAFTLHLLADSFGRGIGGFLVQRFGLGLVAATGSTIGLLALLAVPSARSPILLFALSIVWGLSLSAVPPGMMTLSSRQAVKGREGRALTLTNMLVAPFTGLGGLGVGFLTKIDPKLALELMIAGQVLALLAALTLIFRPERVPPPTKQEYYPWTRLLLFIPAAFGQTFAPMLFSQLIFPYTKVLGLAGGWIVAAVGLGGIFSYGLTAWTARYADKYSPRGLLIGGLGLLGVALLWLGSSPSLLELLIIAVAAGVGMACFSPAWNALVVKLLPEANRAAVWGTLMLVEVMGTALGPAVGQTLAQTTGISTPFYVAGAIFLALSVFYIVALWRPFWNSPR